MQRIIAGLKPGGWIVIEDVDSVSAWPDPKLNSGETLLKTSAAMHQIMTQRGADLRFGRKLAHRLCATGLDDVDSEGRIFMWRGKSPGATLLRANFAQLHDPMIAAGLISEEEYAADTARLEDPSFMMPSILLWAAWGRVRVQ
ncbi:MAG: hypothetical protein WBC04_04225 [Candidatus Acidiferrales bacterium]